MDKLLLSVENFVSLQHMIPDGGASLFHRVVSGMHDLCACILDAEKKGIPDGDIEKTIRPARDLHGRSVFVKRLQEWPREYPGDFETIEYICSLENKSQYGKIEYYIEEYALNSAMAQQHRNKVQRQSEIILDALLNGARDQKILSVGCGGSRDMLRIIKHIAHIPCDLVLHDRDREALALSGRRLADMRARVNLVGGNFLQAIRRIEDSGPFDVILTGGLFDYLSDKHIEFFLKHALHKLLKQGSMLFFSNIKKDNPYKVWQEYLANWKLVYRNEDDIRTLLSVAGFSEAGVAIERDETGLTFLVTAKK